MIQDIPFGPFLPDAPSYKNPGLVRCENVYAASSAYNPIRALVPFNITVSGEVRGAARVDLADSDSLMVVGTDSDLYIMRAGVFFPSGLGLSLIEDETWSFDQLGRSLYATCSTGGLYRLENILIDNTFAPCPGSPPRAAQLDTVGDFLFLGNLFDIDGTDQPYRVRWSAFNNPTEDWVTDIGRQSGYVDMPARYGEVTGIFGNRFDIIFQKHGISRVWFSGGATVFSKEVIEDERGCPAPSSIVSVGGFVYFLASDGFCRTNGATVEVISSDRVWSWFLDELADGYLYRTQGAVDWANRSIIWSFYPSGFTSYRRQIIYNWGLDRWTTASFEVDWLIEGNRDTINIDETDPTVIDDDILDVDGPSFDSSLYLAQGRALVGMIGGSFAGFLGGSLKATFESGDFQPKVGFRSFVRSVFPIIESAEPSAKASIAGREWTGGAKTFTPLADQGPLGFCPVISDARFQSVRIEKPANSVWKKAAGFQVDWEASGEA